jgi:hypothetical protein
MRTPMTMPTMMSTSCLVLNLPSSSSIGAGDGDAGVHAGGGEEEGQLKGGGENVLI